MLLARLVTTMSNISISISPLISPTKARRDAAQAKDWAYVSSWLADKYAPRPVPRFEHNPETLAALLELVRVNEAADREAELIHQAEEEEWRRYEAAYQREDRGPYQEIIDGLDESLDERGKKALTELAGASLLLGTLSADPTEMGERIIELSAEKFEAEERLRRIGSLQRQLEREMEKMETSIERIDSQVDETAREDIQQQTAQLNRETKQFTTKMGEYSERIAALERFTISSPSISEVREDEQRVKKLQVSVKALERQVAELHGLPPDLAASREEYQRVHSELQELRRQRDGLFHRMVDRG
jgi:HAUS augmin-like complex subunit 1